MIALAAPALPLHTAGPYVAAAYVVFVALILVYLAIMAVRLTRTQRELSELREQLMTEREPTPPSADPDRELERV